MMTAAMKVGYKTPPAVFNGKVSELYDTIDELKEELDEAKIEVEHWKSIAEQSQWLSVNEKLPDEDGEYLVNMYHRFMIGGIYKKYTGRFVAKYYAEYKEWRIMNDVCTSVTHWQYLPSPPKEDNADV